MRRLLLILVVLSFLTTGSGLTFAQGSEDCDPEEVFEWLRQRQAWRNATSETWQKVGEANLGSDAIPSVLNEFHRHMQAIADLSRPVCADTALLWTFYLYDLVGRLWVCHFLDDDDCLAEMQNRSAIYGEQIEIALAPLYGTAGITAKEYESLFGELLPEGWSWPPESLRAYFPATYVDGMLDFEGSGDMVTDPVTVPKGYYRVLLETEDTGMSIDMVVLSGKCYVGSSTWETTVFSLKANGAQSLITSEECEVMWQVRYADGTFKVTFEKIR